MKKEIEVNDYFINWLSEIVADMIKNTMIDEPEKVPILIAANEILYKANFNNNENIDGYIGNIMLDKIFKEIRKIFKEE